MLHAPVLLRPFATGFGLVLGLLAAWIMAAELLRPNVQAFPADAAQANAMVSQESAAALAAWAGWPRGDLWTDYVVTANAATIGSLITWSAPQSDKRADEVAEMAATLAPSDARAWLLLAVNAESAKTAALLKMSYYTSPYSDALAPLRLQVATRSPGIADEELSSFVEYELGVIVGQKPDLKRTVASAYRTASPAGRRFFDAALAKLDPKFLTEIKAANP